MFESDFVACGTGRSVSATTSAVLTVGGARRDRTADPLLAKQVLSQLSYGPDNWGQTPIGRLIGV